MYLNGPAAAVGLLSATALSGLTSVSATAVGFVGVGSAVGIPGALAMGLCPGPFLCQVQTSCCLIVMGTNGFVCPLSC